MSMTEADIAETGVGALPPAARMEMPRTGAPIVPGDSIAARALVAVVAIMTFLASLTAGAVVITRATAADWQSDVAREVTIQIRPAADRDVEAAANKAAEIARGFPGVAGVRVYTREESGKLLEPWLGAGLALDDLPVPRIVAVRLSGEVSDTAPLRKALADQVTGATLDDHRTWNQRMRAVAGTVVIAGIALLALMIAVTVMAVMFATRGAMAATRTVIEVLHFVGAKNDYIAARFQRHFLRLGLQGGAVGGIAAMLVFAIASVIAPAGSDTAMMFGDMSMGVLGYAAIVMIVVIIAAVTAITSRHTVNRTLDTID